MGKFIGLHSLEANLPLSWSFFPRIVRTSVMVVIIHAVLLADLHLEKFIFVGHGLAKDLVVSYCVVVYFDHADFTEAELEKFEVSELFNRLHIDSLPFLVLDPQFKLFQDRPEISFRKLSLHLSELNMGFV